MLFKWLFKGKPRVTKKLVGLGKSTFEISGIISKYTKQEDVTTFFYEDSNGKRTFDYECHRQLKSLGAFDSLIGDVRLWQEGGELPNWAKKVDFQGNRKETKK